MTNRQHQYFCSGLCLAVAVVQSGFYSVFMILAVWVVCLCLDNSRARSLSVIERLTKAQPEGWSLGLWTGVF